MNLGTSEPRNFGTSVSRGNAYDANLHVVRRVNAGVFGEGAQHIAAGLVERHAGRRLALRDANDAGIEPCDAGSAPLQPADAQRLVNRPLFDGAGCLDAGDPRAAIRARRATSPATVVTATSSSSGEASARPSASASSTSLPMSVSSRIRRATTARRRTGLRPTPRCRLRARRPPSRGPRSASRSRSPSSSPRGSPRPGPRRPRRRRPSGS